MSRDRIGNTSSELITLSIRNATTGAWTAVDALTDVTWKAYEIDGDELTEIDSGTADPAQLSSSDYTGMYVDYADMSGQTSYSWVMVEWTYTIGGDEYTSRDWMQVVPSGEDVPSQVDDLHDWLADGGRLDLLIDAINSKTQLITSGGVTVSGGSHLASDNMTLTLIKGQVYNQLFGSQITFDVGDTRIGSDRLSDGTYPILLLRTLKDEAAIVGTLDSVSGGLATVSFEVDLDAAEAWDSTESLDDPGTAGAWWQLNWALGGQVANRIISVVRSPLVVSDTIDYDGS